MFQDVKANCVSAIIKVQRWMKSIFDCAHTRFLGSRVKDQISALNEFNGRETNEVLVDSINALIKRNVRRYLQNM